jgi:protein-L-isoaspartate(D-aspartate) O-methyltransferase
MVFLKIFRRHYDGKLWVVLLCLFPIIFFYGCTVQKNNKTSFIPTSTNSPSPTLRPTTFKVENIEFIQARKQLVAKSIEHQKLENEDVIKALGSVPRHLFVPEDLVAQAYEDYALPIGYGQTISQPSLVAKMTELLELEPGDKVLEIGTGSGYQAAILAELGYVEVYSIEIVPELYERSSEILEELGYENVSIKQGDGYYGWEAYAPFDAIIVTAAPDHLPAPLAEQIGENGRIVIPIGPPGFYQTLWKFVKQNGELTAYNMGSVMFVPFTGSGVSEGAEQVPTP